MRKQTDAEKAEMCTRPPQEALSFLGVSYCSEVAAALQSARTGWELGSGGAHALAQACLERAAWRVLPHVERPLCGDRDMRI